MSERQRQLILTPTGLKQIEDELRHLQTVRRQEVAEHIRQAKDFGDVTENAEYEEAKTEQAFLESRISELKGILGSAEFIDESEIPTDKIGIGSIVSVKDLDMDEDWEFTLVGSYEANPETDQISNESPIGEALFGALPGDVVEVEVPAGKLKYQVISIRK